MHTLDYYKTVFNGVGWFIPPYVAIGFMSALAREITRSNGSFSQENLEQALSLIYSPENLAAMVMHRYPITPQVLEYKLTIAEAIEAHFMGLNHIAVSGLLPVIEGVGLKLAEDRSVKVRKRGSSFTQLAEHCKKEVIEKKIGAVGEVVSMLESFITFTENHLYIDSANYQFSDKTNRHGILHGAYTDNDYGSPINFYKTIASVDFLCFISAIRASISWFAPDQTDVSTKLATYYRVCTKLSESRPVDGASKLG